MSIEILDDLTRSFALAESVDLELFSVCEISLVKSFLELVCREFDVELYNSVFF